MLLLLDMHPPLHEQLAAEVDRAGLSHSQLADSLGLSASSRPAVSRWLSGAHPPSLASLIRIAGILGRPLRLVIDGAEVTIAPNYAKA